MKITLKECFLSQAYQASLITIISLFAVGAVLYLLDYQAVGSYFAAPLLIMLALAMGYMGFRGFRAIYLVNTKRENIFTKIALILIFVSVTIGAAVIFSGLILHFYDYLFTLPDTFFTETRFGRERPTDTFTYTGYGIATVMLLINLLLKKRKTIME